MVGENARAKMTAAPMSSDAVNSGRLMAGFFAPR